jgi:pimeloyl-ACP methyl ester carboxylesterase
MNKVRSKDGTAIAYETVGSGPSLILVGGAFCDRTARAAGRPLAELLAPHFTVFIYDRRGRADSEDTAPYATLREIEDLEALIATAGGSAFVYGHSSGALLALDAAERHLPIEKLALYEAPVILDASRPKLPEDLPARLFALAAAGRRGETAALFLTEGVGVPPETVAQMQRAPFWAGLEAIAHTVPYDATIADQGAALVARASLVRVPTIVMNGSASPPWMRHANATLAAAIAGAQHLTLEGQTHDVDPKAVARELTAFGAPAR